MISNRKHEHHIPDLDKKGLREFGFVTGGIAAGLFGLLIPWLFGFNYPRWPWILFAVLAIVALVYPLALRPVYKIWMRFGLLMGRIMSPLVLGIVFFVVITPVALFMKIISRDALKRRLDVGENTYRVESSKKKREQIERPY